MTQNCQVVSVVNEIITHLTVVVKRYTVGTVRLSWTAITFPMLRTHQHGWKSLCIQIRFIVHGWIEDRFFRGRKGKSG